MAEVLGEWRGKLFPHKVGVLEGKVSQSVENKNSVFTAACLQLARGEVHCDSQLAEVVKDAGYSGVGVIILLWRLHLPASLADEPRRQGGEEVELLPRVGGHGEVMSVQRLHLEVNEEVFVVAEQFEFVQQVVHHHEGHVRQPRPPVHLLRVLLHHSSTSTHSSLVCS